MYNPLDHYWIVDGDESLVYSSYEDDYVSVSDERYTYWLEDGNFPTKIISSDLNQLRIQFLEETITPRRLREHSIAAAKTASSRNADDNAAIAFINDINSQIVTLREGL